MQVKTTAIAANDASFFVCGHRDGGISSPKFVGSPKVPLSPNSNFQRSLGYVLDSSMSFVHMYKCIRMHTCGPKPRCIQPVGAYRYQIGTNGCLLQEPIGCYTHLWAHNHRSHDVDHVLMITHECSPRVATQDQGRKYSRRKRQGFTSGITRCKPLSEVFRRRGGSPARWSKRCRR